ncbi:MAG: hypothetical protein SV375_00105 [Thermodesulfobacteriota bacterium]|nr:hypothetical protein [Thermodesulfobacteriota bacterium]
MDTDKVIDRLISLIILVLLFPLPALAGVVGVDYGQVGSGTMGNTCVPEMAGTAGGASIFTVFAQDGPTVWIDPEASYRSGHTIMGRNIENPRWQRSGESWYYDPDTGAQTSAAINEPRFEKKKGLIKIFSEAGVTMTDTCRVEQLAGLFAESLGSEQWENGTTPYFVRKNTLSLDDVYANPGVSLIDAGKTNFQTGMHSWTTYAANRTYTVLDSGVSVMAVEYGNHLNGAYNFLQDSDDLTTDLTVGAAYQYTATVKMNTGSANVRINDTSTVLSRDIVETEWTGVTITFIAKHYRDCRALFYNLSTGETIFIKEWDLRELTSRSVLGDETGDPELVVNGIAYDDTTQWYKAGGCVAAGVTHETVGGISAFALEANGGSNAVFRQDNTVNGPGLYRWKIKYYVSSNNATVDRVRIRGYSDWLTPFLTTTDAWTEARGYTYFSKSAQDRIMVYFGNITYQTASGDSVYVTDISAQKINTSWVPYGGNTLALSAVDSGISITYVDNGSGASIYLDSLGDAKNNLTIGSTYKITCFTRINTGDVDMVAYDGAGNKDVDYNINETTGTTKHCYITVAGASPYIEYQGLGAGEEVWSKRWSVKEVSDAGSDNEGPPEGTLVMDVIPNFDMDDVTAAHGVFTTSDAAVGLLYISSAGRFASYDGTSTCYETGSGVSLGQAIRLIIDWGYLDDGVAKFRIRTNTGSGIEAGDVNDYDGAFPAGSYDNLFYGLQGGYHWGPVGVWDRILTDALYDQIGEP